MNFLKVVHTKWLLLIFTSYIVVVNFCYQVVADHGSTIIIGVNSEFCYWNYRIIHLFLLEW
jgi:hypothetical protein